MRTHTRDTVIHRASRQAVKDTEWDDAVYPWYDKAQSGRRSPRWSVIQPEEVLYPHRRLPSRVKGNNPLGERIGQAQSEVMDDRRAYDQYAWASQCVTAEIYEVNKHRALSNIQTKFLLDTHCPSV